MNRADLRFAEFIDTCLGEYMRSAEYRAALHSEEPGQTRVTGVCPPDHRHSETGTCYAHHGCRCRGCRDGMSRRQKQARVRRAVAQWRQEDRKAS